MVNLGFNVLPSAVMHVSEGERFLGDREWSGALRLALPSVDNQLRSSTHQPAVSGDEGSMETSPSSLRTIVRRQDVPGRRTTPRSCFSGFLSSAFVVFIRDIFIH